VVNFDLTGSLVGGLLIGLSVSILLLFNGRMAGISGIMKGILKPSESVWRLTFLLGLIIGASAYTYLSTDEFTPRQGYPLWLIVVGGFLVGIGTRLGSGCTSGHGICGIANGSRRSILATLIFMSTGIGTVYLLRHVVGIDG